MRIVLNENQLNLLLESFTDITYHFCSLPALEQILEDGEFRLTISSNKPDAFDNKKLFYLSTQRSKSFKRGFAGRKKPDARIELNGYKLKSDGYKGLPIDYWGEKMGKQMQFKDSYAGESFEYEDRILSDKPFLPIKYINRIDFIIRDNIVYGGRLKRLLQLAELRGVKLFFYGNEFDCLKQNDKILNDKVANEDVNTDYKKDDYVNQNSIIKLMTHLSILYLYIETNNYPMFTKEDVSKLQTVFNRFNLNDFSEAVSNNIIHRKNFDTPFELAASLGFEDTLRFIGNNRGGGFGLRNEHSNDILLFAQHILRIGNCSNFQDLAQNIKNHVYDKTSSQEQELEHWDSVTMVKFSRKWEKERWYYGGTPWKIVTNLDGDGVVDLIRQCQEQSYEYDDWQLNHKSKSDNSFYGYVKRTVDNGASMLDVLNIFKKINLPFKFLSGWYGFNPIEVKTFTLENFGEIYDKIPVFLTKYDRNEIAEHIGYHPWEHY